VTLIQCFSLVVRRHELAVMDHIVSISWKSFLACSMNFDYYFGLIWPSWSHCGSNNNRKIKKLFWYDAPKNCGQNHKGENMLISEKIRVFQGFLAFFL
jgi:hypothetical protein